jgi:DNA-binding CsgD family transcriptional regulator
MQQWADLYIKEALISARRAVALLQRGPDSQELAFVLIQLGVLLVNLDRDEEALAVIDQGLEVESRLGSNRWRIRGQLYRGRARAHLGDWRSAADAWAKIGAPYERALELVDSGVPEAMLEGLSVLDGLGAAPAAALVRHRLRGLGHTQVPRGPQAGTRTNPAGLTGRQLEILRLLSAGLTNAEIAARLVLSVRTVDHHVSAVLQKLGVSSRAEAAVVASGLGR